ncbi:tetratricopeptide repeat protein [Prevotella intermedia]|uniref:TPR domain protein n=2 Tax=Prevotella intermedia TaxID=28131 RepID=A0A0T7ANF6_PREIN|nr:tetratricopeptide repeat protein [Prevotella intermedia]BAU18536.1 TPR domain protein [Prevotella intermedia]
MFMRISKEQIIRFIVPQFKWWFPCWYAFLADIALLAIFASVTNIVNVSKMEEKSGTLEWVKHKIVNWDDTNAWYSYGFKLKNDTTIYEQTILIERHFRPFIFNFNSVEDNPYCKRGDKVSFYLDSPPKQDKAFFEYDRQVKKNVTLCYGLKVNGEVAFNSIWIFRDTIAFSVLYVLGLFLTFPIIIMLTLDFGSNWHRTIGVDNNDQLIEKADSYWVNGMLLKKRNKNYKKAETIYLKVLKRSPKDYRALSMYASMLIEQKRYDDADTIYERMYKIDKGTANAVSESYSNIEGCEERAEYWSKKES